MLQGIEFARPDRHALLDGALKISIGGRYTFDTVQEAHEALEGRRMIGKPTPEIAPDGD